MDDKSPSRGKEGPGRPPVCEHPVKKRITFDAAVLQKLKDASREQGRTVPDLVRRAVDSYLDPHTLTVTLAPSMAEQLEAISRAAPHGRVLMTEMVQRAVEEFATRRLQTPDVQQALTAMRGAALHLVPRSPPTEQASAVGDAQKNPRLAD